MTSLNAISIPPTTGQPPQGLIVLLHGWGANCKDLVGLAEFMNLSEYQLVFPDAPLPHPHNPMGKMWYDFPAEYRFLGTPEFGDRLDVSTSRQLLIDLLTTHTKQLGIPFNKTILGGFSQGGAMILDVGVRMPLAGLMVLSGYLHAPLQPQVSEFPPVLMVHGQQDTVVPLSAAHQSRNALQALGASVQYQEYAMGHEIQPIVLRDLQSFVKEKLPVS